MKGVIFGPQRYDIFPIFNVRNIKNASIGAIFAAYNPKKLQFVVISLYLCSAISHASDYGKG